MSYTWSLNLRIFSAASFLKDSEECGSYPSPTPHPTSWTPTTYGANDTSQLITSFVPLQGKYGFSKH